MELSTTILTIMGVAYMVPTGWLFYLVRTTGKRVDEMQKTSYTKAETNEMIELHNRPILLAVSGIKESIIEIKHMIGKLFDGQAK